MKEPILELKNTNGEGLAFTYFNGSTVTFSRPIDGGTALQIFGADEVFNGTFQDPHVAFVSDRDAWDVDDDGVRLVTSDGLTPVSNVMLRDLRSGATTKFHLPSGGRLFQIICHRTEKPSRAGTIRDTFMSSI